MSTLTASPMSAVDAASSHRDDAASVRDAYRGILATPALQHGVDLAVLSRIAADQSSPLRERRRAAEVLARLRTEALKQLAAISGARSQALHDLGIDGSGRKQGDGGVQRMVIQIHHDVPVNGPPHKELPEGE